MIKIRWLLPTPMHWVPNGISKWVSLFFLGQWSAPYQRHIRNISIGTLCNTLPFLSTWGGLLLLIVDWLQVEVLSIFFLVRGA